MSQFLITVIVLLAAALTLFLAAGWRQRAAHPDDRDRLNTAFYQQRLRELTRDEEEGVVDERDEMVRELQHTLLADVPDRDAVNARPTRRWVLLPGALVLVVLSLGMYLHVGGVTQFASWKSVQDAYPALRARLMDPHAQPLSMEELARLQLGLRSALQDTPRDLTGWTMLGRLGMVLNNATLASQAFERALQLSPNDAALQQDYAEVLTRSSDPQDNRQASVVLKALEARDPHDLRTLGLLAYNAFTLQQYAMAITTWQRMLTDLPAGDKRITLIERSIEQAKTDAGEQTRSLALSVRLAPQAEKMLPPGGVLYISVSDGVSPVPVAVKRLPLSHFPLSLTLDDSNTMMPDRLLSAQHQVQVRARISRDGSANPQPGDWFGLSAVTPWDGQQPLAVDINQQQP